MSEKVGVAVIGAGNWGKNHVRNFANMPSVTLRYVCDRSEEIRARTEAAYPGVACVDELDRVLGDDQVAAVVVATHAPSHAEVALAAIEAGKDVFVEKPLALSSADALRLCEKAEAGKRILMVGHLLLHHPAVLSLRDLVDSGELGEVLYVYAHRLNLGVVRRDENAWWSLAPHDISVANFLLDAEPESVTASGATFLQTDRGIEDVVFASMHYPGGRLAHVHVSWLDPYKTRRLTVVGSKKMAVFDDTSPDQKLVVFDKGVEPPPATLSYEQGVRIRTGDIRIPALKMVEPLRRECEAFIESVRSRHRSPTAAPASASSARSRLGPAPSRKRGVASRSPPERKLEP